MILLLATTLVLATLLFLVFLLNQQVRLIIFVLEFVTTICDLITLPVYLLIDRPWKIQLRSKTHTAERHYEPNGNYHYWQAKVASDSEKEVLSDENRLLKSSLGKLTHLSELLSVVEKVHKGKKCLGRRRVLSRKVKDGEVKFELSNEYEWKSYEEVLATMREFAKILHHKFQLKCGDRVAIFAETSPEYFIMFFALQLLGCEVITMRSTRDEKIIPFILNLNEIKLVFTQTNFVKLLNKLKPDIQTVSKLICFRHPFGSETDEEEVRNAKYELFEYEQLLKESRDLPGFASKTSLKFSSTDIAAIMNTSGSTGLPKCVLIKHANWISFLKGVTLGLNNEDTFLAYVEGSQIMELTREISYFTCGTKMAFGTNDTFLTGSGLLAKGCIGDLQASEATHTIGFPQTLERFRSLIETSIRSKPACLAAIYDFAYEYKRRWTKRGFRCRLVDALLFKSIKNGFGKRLQYIFTGGAPLRLETGTFLKLHLNINMTLGYGATETMGAAITTFDQFDHAESFTILDGVKLRLENWEEGGYRLDDKPNPRGEVLIGSGMVSAGYYKNEKETNEVFLEENGTRWWRSGDIGEINEYGQLLLIDRKGNFAKLQSTNYVTMGKVESILKGCRLVKNLAIHVNPYSDYATAIVSPDEENIRKLAEELGKDTGDLTRLYKDEDLERAGLDELAKFGAENGLLPYEKPARVKLVPEKWTPENGLVSETLKIRRKNVYTFYQDLIDSMYKPVKTIC